MQVFVDADADADADEDADVRLIRRITRDIYGPCEE